MEEERKIDQRKEIEERRERKPIRFGIPRSLRFSLAFTIFFSIIGIVSQSVQHGGFVFIDFFVGNYGAWLTLFGSLTGAATQEAAANMLASMAIQWYYLLYTGGLISLVWNLLILLINKEIRVR